MKRFLLFLQSYHGILINTFSIVALFALPYYIFQGKLFVGGDDTKLLYAYPWEYLQAMSFFSWTNISSVAAYNPNNYSLPFALVWSLLYQIIKSRVIIDYIAFSLPLVMGFVYLQLLLKELLPESSYSERFVSVLFYILSPILAINQLSVFLMSAWLIGLIPFIAWNLVCYIKTNNFNYVLTAVIVCVLLSLGLYTIPWTFGLLLPLFLVLPLGLFLFKKIHLRIFFTKAGVFFGCILLSQSFWILPFITTFLIKGGNNLGDLFVNTASTFRATVLQTSTGNIVYPLLGLFHRQLTFDYQWDLRNIFVSFYDKVFFLGTVFIVIFFGGLFRWKKILTELEGKIYLFILATFFASLFLYTVNIGPLREIFLFMGHLPGFIMFRNAYDKFAPGYVFFFSLLFAYSLHIVIRNFSKYKYFIIFFVFFVLFLNAIPLKAVINSPLWTTKKSLRTIIFPQEYLKFLSEVKKTVDPTGNILNFPLNVGGYALIKEDGTNNIFAGTSPTKFFTGINDFSGDLSFSQGESGKMWALINKRDYEGLRNFLYTYNVSSIMVTKNIPDEVRQSYLFFGGSLLQNQDSDLVMALADKKLITSSKGNYELYSVKKPNLAFDMSEGYFQKINPVKYHVFMHLNSSEKLVFLDSYHNGWNLFLEKYDPLMGCKDSVIKSIHSVSECMPSFSLFQWNELSYILKRPLAQQTHKFTTVYRNVWEVDPEYIQSHFDNSFYKKYPDGSIDITVTVYFMPQEIFYFGIVITLLTVGGLIFYSTIIKKQNAKN